MLTDQLRPVVLLIFSFRRVYDFSLTRGRERRVVVLVQFLRHALLKHPVYAGRAVVLHHLPAGTQ